MIYGPGRQGRKDFIRAFRWDREYQQLADREAAMTWEQEKDELILEVDTVKLSDKEDLFVGIYSYNKGPRKIGVNRKTRTFKGTVTSALRRMTQEEARIVGQLLSQVAADCSFWEEKPA